MTGDLAGTATVTAQAPQPWTGHARSGDFYLATSGDLNLATSGDFFMATDETSLTRLACPECGGSLAQIQLPSITYYRCHVGHQYGPQSLAAAQLESAEAKLWSAMSALEESAAFSRHLAEQGDVLRDQDATEEHRHAADRADRLVSAIRAQLQPLD